VCFNYATKSGDTRQDKNIRMRLFCLAIENSRLTLARKNKARAVGLARGRYFGARFAAEGLP